MRSALPTATIDPQSEGFGLGDRLRAMVVHLQSHKRSPLGH